MPKGFKFLTVFTLVFSILFGPMLPEIYAQSTAAEIEQAQADFQPIYNEIMKLETLEAQASMSLMDFASGVHNAGEWIKEKAGAVAAWFTGDDSHKYEAQYEDYKAKIEEANQGIRDAKAQAQEIMSLIQSGDLNAAKQKQKTSGFGSLEEAASAKKAQQDTLTKAGTDLKNAGEVLETTGTVLSIVSAAAKLAAALFPPAAGAILAVTKIADVAIDAIEIGGALMKATGESLIATAQSGMVSDGALLGNVVKDVAVEGAKQYVTRVASKKIAELGSNALKGSKALASAGKEGVEELAKIGQKATKEITEEIVEKGTKEITEEIVEKGTKEITEEVIERGGKEVAEAATDAIVDKGAKEAAEAAAKNGGRIWNGLGFKTMLSKSKPVTAMYEKLMSNPKLGEDTLKALKADKFLEGAIMDITKGSATFFDKTEILPVKVSKVIGVFDKGVTGILEPTGLAKDYMDIFTTKSLNSIDEDAGGYLFKKLVKDKVGLR